MTDRLAEIRERCEKLEAADHDNCPDEEFVECGKCAQELEAASSIRYNALADIPYLLEALAAADEMALAVEANLLTPGIPAVINGLRVSLNSYRERRR
jgi:hypothetical protein